VIAWSDALHELQWIGMLLARLSVGLLFVLSGGGKLFVAARREQMLATIRQARIPAPAASARAVSAVELTCGSLLVIGLFTRFSCVMLSAVMAGALWTTVLPRISQTKSTVAWLGAFLYLPEVLYVIILVWLFFSGPGWASVDRLTLCRHCW
jgi:putative oxidoreductase